MQRWLQKEGTLHPSFFLLLLPFQPPPLTPPANRSHTPPFSNGCQNIHTHSATQVFCFCPFSDMCPHMASNCFMPGCLVSLSRLGYGWPDTHLWGLSSRYCQFLAFFLTLIKAAKCPWQSHFFFFFFAQVLVSPASFAARSGHMIQSWPKDQGGILLGVIPGKIFLLFKTSCGWPILFWLGHWSEGWYLVLW